MRALVSFATLLLVLAGAATAAEQNPAELKARADAASGEKQAKLCLEYAQLQLETSNHLFTDGDVEKGMQQVQEVVAYSQKGADAASSSGKLIKETEIKLRKLAERMHDIGESLALEERQPVRDAVQALQKIRSNLMVRMW